MKGCKIHWMYVEALKFTESENCKTGVPTSIKVSTSSLQTRMNARRPKSLACAHERHLIGRQGRCKYLSMLLGVAVF